MQRYTHDSTTLTTTEEDDNQYQTDVSVIWWVPEYIRWYKQSKLEAYFHQSQYKSYRLSWKLKSTIPANQNQNQFLSSSRWRLTNFRSHDTQLKVRFSFSSKVSHNQKKQHTNSLLNWIQLNWKKHEIFGKCLLACNFCCLQWVALVAGKQVSCARVALHAVMSAAVVVVDVI